MIQIAVDPGMNCGIASFEDGKFLCARTVKVSKRKGEDTTGCLSRLWDLLETWYISERFPLDTEVVVEEFVHWLPLAKARDLMTHGEYRGLVVAFFLSRGCVVKELCKSTASKDEAVLIANSLGFKGTDHEMDAIHIGALAGFLK